MFSFLRDKKKWESISKDEKYKPLLDKVLEAYETLYKDTEIPVLPFSKWMNYLNYGERQEWEKLYFLRRSLLTVYALLSLIYPENDLYFSKLQDVVCAILEEYSWCVPAHVPYDRPNKFETIDLFAAETGLYMAEVKYIFAERLSPFVTERITKEIKRRIIDSLKNNNYFFEECKSNWGAVCGGSVAMTLFYEDTDAYVELKPRIRGYMSNYLESIGEDGSVSEGVGYWNYGFGFYLMYSDMLYRYTYGREDNFKSEKVHKLSHFFNDMLLSESMTYSFSDSHETIDYYYFNMFYLSQKFGLPIPPLEYGNMCFQKLSMAIRTFLFFDTDAKTTEKKNEQIYYEVLKCFITKKDKYSFAIKGGHNMEEHNHNDVGSFVLVANDKQLLCDPGAPVYCFKSMGKDAYDDTILEKSSLGHNVPVINGKSQGYGREYCSDMEVYDNKVVIDFKKAYRDELSKLTREVSFSDDKIILKDEYDKNCDFVERFVTKTKPDISGNEIKIESLRIICPDNGSISVKQQESMTSNRAKGASSPLVKHMYYLIDIKLPENSESAVFELSLNNQH